MCAICVTNVSCVTNVMCVYANVCKVHSSFSKFSFHDLSYNNMLSRNDRTTTACSCCLLRQGAPTCCCSIGTNLLGRAVGCCALRAQQASKRQQRLISWIIRGCFFNHRALAFGTPVINCRPKCPSICCWLFECDHMPNGKHTFPIWVTLQQ